MESFVIAVTSRKSDLKRKIFVIFVGWSANGSAIYWDDKFNVSHSSPQIGPTFAVMSMVLHMLPTIFLASSVQVIQF